MSKLEDLGGKTKFLVVKLDELNELPVSTVEDVYFASRLIAKIRKGQDKPAYNEYLVINLDEPYAPEIIEILKRNGHWG